MKLVRPTVVKIGETKLIKEGVREMLEVIGASEETIQKYLAMPDNGESLIELAGRICYESYEVGLNPNVTRIRQSSTDYLGNLIRRAEGSVYEQSVVHFALLNISRVCSHEIVRHRVGTAISQESLRYVRPHQIKFWIPDELNEQQKQAMQEAIQRAEEAYRDLENAIPWDKLPMETKKRLTSALRRILPDGLATNMVWSANHRTLRWVIEMRTDPAAEVEIRMVFDQVAQICKRDYPNLYQDFISEELADGTRSWKPTLKSKI